MNIRHLLILSIVSIGYLNISPALSAEPSGEIESHNFFLGGLGGATFVSNGIGGSGTLGLELGWQPLPNIAIGAQASRIFLREIIAKRFDACAAARQLEVLVLRKGKGLKRISLQPLPVNFFYLVSALLNAAARACRHE